MEWTDQYRLLMEALENDSFMRMDWDTQVLYFYLVKNAAGDMYSMDFETSEVYDLAREIGFDSDENIRNSVDALTGAGFIFSKTSVALNRNE